MATPPSGAPNPLTSNPKWQQMQEGFAQGMQSKDPNQRGLAAFFGAFPALTEMIGGGGKGAFDRYADRMKAGTDATPFDPVGELKGPPTMNMPQFGPQSGASNGMMPNPNASAPTANPNSNFMLNSVAGGGGGANTLGVPAANAPETTPTTFAKPSNIPDRWVGNPGLFKRLSQGMGA